MMDTCSLSSESDRPPRTDYTFYGLPPGMEGECVCVCCCRTVGAIFINQMRGWLKVSDQKF